ncbi:MAG: glycine cleavage system protein H [Desulfohalobiaceae bacterium]|nr:glycine cleavage system protein H [Desulfohalobiaceae bacterium]
MTQKKQNTVQAGYGSSYTRMTKGQDQGQPGIDAVLGGHVWRIKPDERAKAENPCLWMQAGVVKFKTCTNYYDCNTCKYDQAMHKKAASGDQLSWQEAMRRKPDMQRICRHSLTNRIPNRICPFHYECSTCDFDQYFEDVLSPKTETIPREIQTVRGFDLPMGHYFHQGHTWARIESGGQIRIGMDDFALKLFGQMDGFDLPLMGKVLDHNQECWGLKQKDRQAEVLSPVDGIITEVNQEIRENPERVNRDPYGDGWLFLVRHQDIKKCLKPLMDDSTGLEWLGQEVNILESMLEEVSGPLAADGGLLQPDVYGNCPDLGWANLTRTFLKTG